MRVIEEPAATGEPAPPLRKNRDFMLLWTGAGFNLLGVRITAVAYPLSSLPAMAGQ